ncbi:MAG: glycosyltransferase family 2 protein [Nitrospira sp.]|nr:glycosyltransferase family 2 protein [Nitrospira sp.]
MAELVSILIPAYNAERWIRDTVLSAIHQTWTNREIIIVDDGSTDNTLAIARTYESKMVKVVAQQNKGASVARNECLRYAQGNYVQWLDADDILAPDKISEQMKAATTGQTDLTILSSSFALFYWRWEKAQFVSTPLWKDLTPIEYLIAHLSEGYWMNPAVWLVSRRLTEKAGPWNESLSLNDDGEYFCRVVSLSENIKFVREAKCYYRMSSFNQLSRARSERACESLLVSLELCIRYLRALEDSERTRGASLSCLQLYMGYFYPEKTRLLEVMDGLAAELGGELKPPACNSTFRILKGLIGWNAACAATTAHRKLRLAAAVKWDETLYRIASLSGKGLC